jgi:hypothetical protein
MSWVASPLRVICRHSASLTGCPLYPLKADIGVTHRQVSFGRTHAAQQRKTYSITWSARSRNDAGIVRPGAFAVLRFMKSSN